jgi:hypothetical protein
VVIKKQKSRKGRTLRLLWQNRKRLTLAELLAATR